jgi:hypothetical protein
MITVLLDRIPVSQVRPGADASLPLICVDMRQNPAQLFGDDPAGYAG